jgi:UDP-glucose 4-epimerase
MQVWFWAENHSRERTDAMKLQGKSVMVTGGAGFIGSHLVDGIIGQSPSRLVVVDNLSLGKEANLAEARAAWPDLHFHHQDATDFKVMEELLRRYKVEVVFALAVIPLPRSLVEPKETVDENVALASTICELARLGMFQTLIHYSSSEVYGSAISDRMDENHPTKPHTPYAASKLAQDHIVLSYHETFGIDASVVLPFNNYGPRQNEQAYAGIIPKVALQLMQDQQVTIYGDGKQSRDFIFVKDTVRGTLACYEEQRTRGRVINLGSGRETTIVELVTTLAELAGRDPSTIAFGPERPGDVRRHLADTSLAQELLGFNPTVDLKTGLAETFSWYQSQFGKTL